MNAYYVNKSANPNGHHEVHLYGCKLLPLPLSRQFLGLFHNCHAAIDEAAKTYPENVNGCNRCCPECIR